MDKAQLEQIYARNFDRYLEEWKEFLKFESISTDPAYDDKCRDCASWLVEHLQTLGMESKLLETESKPVVFGHYPGQEGHATVVFYGHYDVQPVDPLEDWDSPPFAPEVRGDRLYARGAQDNKGQVFYVLKALETLIQSKALKCEIKLYLEGEEESGSRGISGAMDSWPELQGDVLMVCDTGAVAAGVPTVTMGLRGIIQLTVRLEGPLHDLHSGSHGGMVKNPAMELARLLSTLHDAEGRIAVEGYYEGVGDIADEDRQLANAAPFDEAQYQKQIGILPRGGEEAQFTPVERKGFRPTMEVNGFHSGYGGPGGKTIIPSQAFAKLSSRLVGQQDPQACLDRLIAHLEAHAPKDLRLSIEDAGVGGPAVLLSSTSEIIQQARAVLQQLSDHEPVFSWEGGSIPVVASMAKVAGAEPLLIGFGLEEDRIHAPNESFSLSQFKLGFLYAALMLARL